MERKDRETGINLRIITRGGEIKIRDVVEYAPGLKYLYINQGSQGVKVISRSIIKRVFRFTGDREWTVNLKQYKRKNS